MCLCGHGKPDHWYRDSMCTKCASRAARFYCSRFRSTTPGSEGATLHLSEHSPETGDTNMSELTYTQTSTLNTAFRWMTEELRNSAVTWEQLSGLPASEIVARYAARQRTIVAELTTIAAMLASPASDTLGRMNTEWGYRVTRDREEAEGELRNAELLLEKAAPADGTATGATEELWT